MAKKRIFFCIVLLAAVICLAGAIAVKAAKPVDIMTLYITLDEDEELYAKEKSAATMEVVYPGQVNGEVLEMDIRARGNTTFYYDKQSYKFDLVEKFDFLAESGAGTSSDSEAKDWVLLANVVDKTLLRNYYTFFVASLMDGIEYSTASMFVEVYFQGEYRGVYQLCEEIEFDEARLDLDDELGEDSAILFEYHHYQKQEYATGTFYGDETMLFDIRSNVSEDTSGALIYRAYTALSAVSDAIYAADEEAVLAAVDIDSFVDMYILEEFVMDIDVGQGSFFLYIKEGDETVYLGPPWDFDRSAGSTWESVDYEQIFAAGDVTETRDAINYWFRDLMKQEWFQERVKERWNEIKDVFLIGLEEVQGVEESYRGLFQENYEMWTASSGQSYESYYEEYYQWLLDRYVFLDEYFNNMV